jgi:hypothetical protein
MTPKQREQLRNRVRVNPNKKKANDPTVTLWILFGFCLLFFWPAAIVIAVVIIINSGKKK